MDKNNLIGVTIVFLLFYIWIQYNAPSQGELAEVQRVQDSIQMVQIRADSLANLPIAIPELANPALTEEGGATDSMKVALLGGRYGALAVSATGTEKVEMIENDLFKVFFTNKGGRIKSVELKEYFKIKVDGEGNESKDTLRLLEDGKNRFDYLLPISGVSGGVNTNDLYFTPTVKGNQITFRASAGSNRYFEQVYTVSPDDYKIDYSVNLAGFESLLPSSTNELELTWLNYLDKVERNSAYERNYSTIYYKETEERPTYCSCTADDQESPEKALKWLANSNQFFNSTLIAQNGFKAELETTVLPEDNVDLKKLTSKIKIPYTKGQPVAMSFYIGPNEYDRMAAFDNGMEDIIPYGWSIFGTINRWIIRPLFNWLSSFVGSAGIVILLLTVLIKLVLYPLTYKMLYSQSKMGALKPRIEALKAKLGDEDPQAAQMETMKLYKEFGVSPLGGCFPIVLQMPIWFALYRFFPASIEFRQAPFLWATDLSSYDVFAYLPFEIPFYGSHVSMFTLLWAFTTIIYTYYNTKHMDMSVNPMMKYMQYFMPVMFLFFFNNFASGLSCYLFFSNVFNIGQTIITKELIIDKKKIEKELEEYRKKPKKKGGFQDRLEKALKDQQKLAEQKDKKNKKK